MKTREISHVSETRCAIKVELVREWAGACNYLALPLPLIATMQPHDCASTTCCDCYQRLP